MVKRPLPTYSPRSLRTSLWERTATLAPHQTTQDDPNFPYAIVRREYHRNGRRKFLFSSAVHTPIRTEWLVESDNLTLYLQMRQSKHRDQTYSPANFGRLPLSPVAIPGRLISYLRDTMWDGARSSVLGRSSCPRAMHVGRFPTGKILPVIRHSGIRYFTSLSCSPEL